MAFCHSFHARVVVHCTHAPHFHPCLCWGTFSLLPRLGHRIQCCRNTAVHIVFWIRFRLKMKLQYFGHLMWRANSLEKILMLGKIEGRRRRGRQDEMAGWHHRLDANEFEQTQGDSEGQGSLAYCSPWGHKKSNRPEWLNNSNQLFHDTSGIAGRSTFLQVTNVLFIS